MDKEKLKEFLNEVGVVKELRPVCKGERPADSVTEVVYKGKRITVSREENETLGFALQKLKKVKRECTMGCGKMVENQVVERRMAFTPEPHWRTRCSNCSKFLHPDGITLIEGAHLVQAAFLTYFKKKI